MSRQELLSDPTAFVRLELNSTCETPDLKNTKVLGRLFTRSEERIIFPDFG
jgi:hypothetical protein